MEYIVCAVCGKTMKQITRIHLKKHNLTIEQYKTHFPDALIFTDGFIESRKWMKGHNYDHGRDDICKKCGKIHINPFLGKHHTLKHKINTGRKISNSLKDYFSDNATWNYGLTKETDERVKKSAKVTSESLIIKWREDLDYRQRVVANHAHGKPWLNKSIPLETREKISRSKIELWKTTEFQEIMRRTRNLKPNIFEKSFQEEFPQLKYTGNFTFFVGSKNPDFILVDTNKCVDVFGDYWHRDDNPNERIEYFKKRTYDLLIVWQSEWKKDKEVIIERVNKFLGDEHFG